VATLRDGTARMDRRWYRPCFPASGDRDARLLG